MKLQVCMSCRVEVFSKDELLLKVSAQNEHRQQRREGDQQQEQDHARHPHVALTLATDLQPNNIENCLTRRAAAAAAQTHKYLLCRLSKMAWALCASHARRNMNVHQCW